MTLATLQRGFLAQIAAPDDADLSAADPRLAAGMAVYRSAYRTRLVDALLDTYPRTARWIGEDGFRAAAAHHLIAHPPSSWTLDLAGEGFAATLVGLSGAQPDIVDLAALEWAMHSSFVAADAVPMTMAQFAEATATFTEANWADMRLELAPSVYLIPVETDCVALWQALRDEASTDISAAPVEVAMCIVWRDGQTPAFRLARAAEAEAIAMTGSGDSFGAMCGRLAADYGEAAASLAGSFLAEWIVTGLIYGLSTGSAAEDRT